MTKRLASKIGEYNAELMTIRQWYKGMVLSVFDDWPLDKAGLEKLAIHCGKIADALLDEDAAEQQQQNP